MTASLTPSDSGEPVMPTGTHWSSSLSMSPSDKSGEIPELTLWELQQQVHRLELQNTDLADDRLNRIQKLSAEVERYQIRAEASLARIRDLQDDKKRIRRRGHDALRRETERSKQLYMRAQVLEVHLLYGDTKKDILLDACRRKLSEEEEARKAHAAKCSDNLQLVENLEGMLDRVKHHKVESWIMEIDDPSCSGAKRRFDDRCEISEPREIFYGDF